MALMIPNVLSMRYTTLEGRSAATQAIFIGGMVFILILIIGTAGWIASKI
jgi:hypothetical protein